MYGDIKNVRKILDKDRDSNGMFSPETWDIIVAQLEKFTNQIVKAHQRVLDDCKQKQDAE